MFMGDTELTLANPLLHTLILGGIISLGKALFGSYQAGFALFIAVQLLLASNCMAQMVLFLKKRRVPLVVILAGLIWTVSYPVIQTLNLNSTKDILCGIFLAYFTMAFWDLIEYGEEQKPWKYVKTFILGLLACLMRNALIFLFIILLLASLLFRLKDRKVYLMLLSTVLLVEGFSLVCGSVLRIPKADFKENLSIPIQQTATVAFMHLSGWEVLADEEDMAILDELYTDMESLMWNYSGNVADYPKLMFRSDVFKSDPLRYLSLYFKLGFQNPRTYYDAFLNMIRFYWNMSESEFRFMAFEYSFQQLNHWGIKRQFVPALDRYNTYLVEATAFESFAFWREPGLCIWLLAILLGLMIARKDRMGQLGVLPVLGYFVGILLGPIALLRYLYPMMLTMPLLFGVLFRRDISDRGSMPNG